MNKMDNLLMLKLLSAVIALVAAVVLANCAMKLKLFMLLLPNET